MPTINGIRRECGRYCSRHSPSDGTVPRNGAVSRNRWAGANGASLVMFLMPGFAVVFGWAFRGEELPLPSFLGLAVVIAVSLPGRRRAV